MNRGDNRSVSIDGSVSDSSIVTGDSNRVTTFTQHTLPPPETVDVRAELATLKELLGTLNVADRNKLDRALADASEEIEKPTPDKEEIAGSLERVVKYVKAAADVSEHVSKIVPPLVAIGSWLGSYGRPLLTMLGVPL